MGAWAIGQEAMLKVMEAVSDLHAQSARQQEVIESLQADVGRLKSVGADKVRGIEALRSALQESFAALADEHVKLENEHQRQLADHEVRLAKLEKK